MTNHLSKTEPTFQHALELNRQLILMSEAGLPVCVTANRYQKFLHRDLSEIETIIAKLLSRGQSMNLILSDEGDLPMRYSAAIRGWAGGRTPDIVLGPFIQY